MLKFAVTGLFCFAAHAADPNFRKTILLDGSWEIAEGTLEKATGQFDRKVPVPGLVSLAVPGFVEPGPEVQDRNVITQKDPRRDAFWYRRRFHMQGPIPAVASLKIGKAMFGIRVILNGKVLGEHLPSFTPGFFDARTALVVGENELVIRVGADRDAVGLSIPNGFDFEKTRYIPGIFDSAELILSGTPHITALQVAPDPESRTIRVQVRLANAGVATNSSLQLTIKEAKSGKTVSQQVTGEVSLDQGSEQTVAVVIPMPSFRAWSPEDPFLYTLQANTVGDRYETRFGMRSFQFDPSNHLARLNGKPYYLRGSNITLYRFFEDPACGSLPWDTNWVRLLHRRMKEMHWNSLRYCIGFPPESWYRIADEEGILLQDEFPIWYGGTGWSKWPAALNSDELVLEYKEWLRERWNHPSVVIWDASNETASKETGVAVQKVRALDLSHRPWDNSYGVPRTPGDVFESHPYHFQNPKFRLADLQHGDPVPQGNELRNPLDSPVIINEYGWLWLNRDGGPTTLTADLYRNLLGTNSTTSARRTLYARYLAAETEFWRSHRNAAGVLHFTALGYSRVGGQTSDHWLDVPRLQWEPEFFKYVRDAFSPVGVIIDAWADQYPAGKEQEFPVILVNDEPHSWSGKVRVRLLKGGRPLRDQTLKASIPPLGQKTVKVSVQLPSESGAYQMEAVLDTVSGAVRSLRDFSIGLETVGTAGL